MIRVDGLVDYDPRQLEELAHDFLRRRKDVQFKIPVNVEALLEGHEHVGEMEVVPGLRCYGVEGCICRQMNDTRLKVYIDGESADGPKWNYLAVVAEELAHVILHRALLIQMKSANDFLDLQRSIHWHQIERDAKYLSAAIRMPFRNLELAAEKLYPQIVDEHGFGDLQRIKMLLKNALSEKFVVPQQDMHRRLMLWPCRIYLRAELSAQGRLMHLTHPDADVIVKERQVQLAFPGFEQT